MAESKPGWKTGRTRRNITIISEDVDQQLPTETVRWENVEERILYTQAGSVTKSTEGAWYQIMGPGGSGDILGDPKEAVELAYRENDAVYFLSATKPQREAPTGAQTAPEPAPGVSLGDIVTWAPVLAGIVKFLKSATAGSSEIPLIKTRLPGGRHLELGPTPIKIS